MKFIKRWLLQHYFSFKKKRFYTSKKIKATDSSQLGESRIIEFIIDSFASKGYNIPNNFLEIGACYFYHLSNSWYLEQKLGFSGFSIDPMSELESEFRLFRKKTTFIQSAYVEATYKEDFVRFYQCQDNGMLSTVDYESYKRLEQLGHRFQEINSKTIKTQDIENLFPSRIGVLILDIESIELQVSILKELTKNRNIKPFLICVETLDISEGSSSCKEIFDNVLFPDYAYIAGTYLNSIYINNELLN